MLTENLKWVPVMNAANVSTGTDCDSINMSGIHKATFLFMCGTVTTDLTITPTTGKTEGTKTNAVTCLSAIGGAVIGTAAGSGSLVSCDVLSAWTSNATAATVSAASNKFFVIEVDGASITTGDSWLTLTVAAGTSGIVFCVAVLEPRFGNNRSLTALK